MSEVDANLTEPDGRLAQSRAKILPRHMQTRAMIMMKVESNSNGGINEDDLRTR